MKTPYNISVEITKDDLKEGLKFVYKHSKASKMEKWFLLVLFVASTVLWYPELQQENGTLVAIITSVIILILMLLVATAFMKVWFMIAIRTSLPKDSRTGVLGKHEFLIEDSYVQEKTEVNETKFTWTSVPHVKKGKKHIYL